ncbi:DUF418 domain-containing protein [Brevibacillus halotolerans]|uniref:DUF418 domain-containing protein n=1 Tax=Brevibacillus halotolerans TaxID=1507437 RepID=UPI001BB39147|nr:DUF418 domain-containing protein [Brevibacillus halotolerans]
MELNRQRITVVDGIRGVSLLGILMANMLIFQYGLWGKDQLHLFSPSLLDISTYSFLKLMVEGSFMPIFTFLFGFSMVKLKESLERRDCKYKRYFIRRFLFLILIGVLHSTYLWEGDILFFYGMSGLALLLFVNRTKKTLLIWGSILLLLPALLVIGSGENVTDAKMFPSDKLEQYVKQTQIINSSGTYTEIKAYRNASHDLGISDEEIVAIMLIAPVLTTPMFLLGMYAAKAGWFVNSNEKRSFYVKRALFFLPAGLLLKSLPSVCSGSWSGIGDLLGPSFLSFGYIFLIALLLSILSQTRWFTYFECVGKLSMTNYVMQTVICTTIFYGYGLGLFGKIGILSGILLSLLIFSLQVVASFWYLRFFTCGPIERLLRMWTYFSWSGRPSSRIASSISIKKTS